MKCNSTLRNLFALTIALTSTVIASAQHTYIDNGGYTSYNLAPGDSLIIRSGIYQGWIGQFDNGAKITVAAGASFQPSGINNPRGAMKNLGTVRFNGWFGTNGGFTLENYGNMSFAQGIALNEGPQLWTNYYGATLRFEAGVTINASTLVNRGTLNTTDITLNSNATLTNNNRIVATGTLAVNGSTFNNAGKFKANGAAFNSGAVLNNSCGLAIDGPITNSSNLYNNGLFWSTSARGTSTSKISNWGTLTNSPNGVVKSVDFVNSGTMAGTGNWYFTGATENTGTVGVNGGGNNKMMIFDATRTSSSQIFDIQYGNVYSSAQWTNLAPPDTTGTQAACATEARTTVLPVKWDFFTATLTDNSPVLTWASEQTPGTVFNIQRSYDAANFTTIGSVNSTDGVKNYRFEDKQVNSNNRSVYYRIRAVETTNEVSISETRSLSFANKTGMSVQASPNPFTSQLNIAYNSTVREKINIRIVSMNGAVMSSKTVNVTTGYNTITITEAASLTKGMYLVQLISENTVIASERVVKQ
ncbi:MAG: T9SS type A sorting domain-containing protein [Chitinophagaceae bacterium]